MIGKCLHTIYGSLCIVKPKDYYATDIDFNERIPLSWVKEYSIEEISKKKLKRIRKFIAIKR
jgi:hypothetical protein